MVINKYLHQSMYIGVLPPMRIIIDRVARSQHFDLVIRIIIIEQICIN